MLGIYSVWFFISFLAESSCVGLFHFNGAREIGAGGGWGVPTCIRMGLHHHKKKDEHKLHYNWPLMVSLWKGRGNLRANDIVNLLQEC